MIELNAQLAVATVGWITNPNTKEQRIQNIPLKRTLQTKACIRGRYDLVWFGRSASYIKTVKSHRIIPMAGAHPTDKQINNKHIIVLISVKIGCAMMS